MLGTLLGLAGTAWSAVRSSRVVQYALIALAVLGAILWLRASARRAGREQAVAEAMQGVIERMERNRETHREIKRLPLSERARRLRELS